MQSPLGPWREVPAQPPTGAGRPSPPLPLGRRVPAAGGHQGGAERRADGAAERSPPGAPWRALLPTQSQIARRPPAAAPATLAPEGPLHHPLRAVKERAHAVLLEIAPQFAIFRGRRPRASMNVGWVLRAQLLMSWSGIVSDRDFCAELAGNAVYRWFLDMRPGDCVPDWWEFARERRVVGECVLGRCFVAVVLAPPATQSVAPQRVAAALPA